MYEVLKETFRSVFGIDAALLFSAPGRTELCGNHTDHQGGMVLAAAVHLETAAAVRPREEAPAGHDSAGRAAAAGKALVVRIGAADVVVPEGASEAHLSMVLRAVASI